MLEGHPEQKKLLDSRVALIKNEIHGIDVSEATVLAFQTILAEDPGFRVKMAQDYADDMKAYQEAVRFSTHSDRVLQIINSTTAAREDIESDGAVDKLIKSGTEFVDVETKPEDLGLLVEKVLELYQDDLEDAILESEYGMTYADFVDYAENGIPEDKEKDFNRVQNDILIPLVLDFQNYVGKTTNQQMALQARNGMYQYIQKMFMVPTEDGYMGNMLDMNFDDESLQGEAGDYSFGNLVKYK